MRIMMTGTRDWPDRDSVWRALNDLVTEFGHDWTLVHGACPSGADRYAEEWAKNKQMNYQGYPAKWTRYNKAAGPIRNQEMVDTAPDYVIAFLRPGSTGTADAIKRAEKAGITVKIITHEKDA